MIESPVVYEQLLSRSQRITLRARKAVEKTKADVCLPITRSKALLELPPTDPNS